MWITVLRGATLLRAGYGGMVVITLTQNVVMFGNRLEDDIWEVHYKDRVWTVDASYVVVPSA